LTVDAISGVATFNNLSFANAGTYTLTAVSNGLAGATSNPITIMAAGTSPPATVIPGVDLDRAKYFRNKIAYNFMAEIDFVYGKYTDGLFSAKGMQSVIADTETLGLTAASAISLAARTKTMLALLATGLAGVNLSIDKNFFGQQTFQAIAISMQARRDQSRATITSNLQLSVTDYPLAAVRQSLVSYFYAGTLPGGLQEIQEEAAKTSTAAGVASSTAGPAAKLTFTQAVGGNAGKPLSSEVVQIQDANGKLVTSATNAIVITSTPPGVMATDNAVSGVATFDNLIFPKEGSYTLNAAANGLVAGTSKTITIVAADAPPPAPPAAPAPAPAQSKQHSIEHMH
jgi:hypothetical protein